MTQPKCMIWDMLIDGVILRGNACLNQFFFAFYEENRMLSS